MTNRKLTAASESIDRQIARLMNDMFIGVSPFDRFETYARSNTNFPPYNYYQIDDSNYMIEMAVAGFCKDEINVQVKEGNILVVSGEKKKTDEVKSYLHQGIAHRSFSWSRSLVENSEVEVSLSDGILKIKISLKPKEDKTRYLEIK